MQTVILTLTWIALVLLRALRFRTSGLTHFELNRRLAVHDDSARDIVERDNKLPLFEALRLLAAGLVAVGLVGTTTVHYGALVGPLLSLVLLYLAEYVSTLRVVQRWTMQLLGRFEPQFLRAATAIAPILKPLVSLREMSGGQAFYSKAELGNLIASDTAVLSPEEKKLLSQGLKFEDAKIADFMTPRSVIDTVEVNETLGPVVLDRLHKTGHSRFPVVDRDIDHVVGMLFLHDLVPLDPKLKRARDAMSRKVYYVHQDRNLDHALHAFLRTKHHLFIVVNDFSEVVGLITIEDCLEQILGRKIVDEFDAYDDLRAVAAKVASKKPETGEVV